MGMLEISEESKKRKNDFIELYNTIKNDKDEFEGTKPYYYGTNYSNPVYICNFLVRLFPFTHISIELQGNRLDDPNRLFLSIVKSFNNSISQKTDVRELIPEFFYLPEMFLNINDINLGKLENDSLVYNVITPCNNNAYSFTEIMKRTFENEKLSSIINNWIDLIFGNKAKGKEAENAKNVFLEESYQESIDLKTIDIDKKIIYLKRVEFGLIPSQVMSKECPKRDKKKEVQKEKELTEYNMNNVHKIKVVQIKHDSSNDKNMKNPDGQKSKLLKADIISNDRIMMLYDNNTIIEDKIGSSNEDIVNIYKINPCDNQINLNYLGRNINKVIKFCNSGMTIIVGGYYDGRFDVINIEEKAEKSRLDFHPFSEEEPILNISLNKEESFLVVGNSIGNVAVYKIDIENDNYELYKKIFNQMSPISDININDDLNLFATASIDGYVNLYTLPLCKRVRSIKVPIDNENHGKFNYVFLSESSLPSIIMITEKGENYEIFSYSINGQLLVNCQDKNMESPIKVKDLNSLEYLIYYANNNEINIRNLPSLCLQITIGNIFNSIRNLVINEDLSSLFAINEDGSQIQAIRD
jgi:WD40 repeat protein